MQNRLCLVFGSICEHGLDTAISYAGENPFVICADGGLDYAKKAGFEPDVCIGDMDSVTGGQSAAKQIVLPRRKDLTDMEAALELAVSHGFERVIVTCAIGGRADHYFANVFMLEYLHNSGVRACIHDGGTKIYYINSGSLKIENAFLYKYVSVIPIDPVIKGVTLEGLGYPLDNATLHRYAALGVSNEPDADIAVVHVKSGAALIMLTE